MAKNIEPKLKKIGDYLKLEEDTVFTIPEYQRAYSWGIDNCDKLWQDINDFVESESKDRYFFGTIIINCQDNDTKYGLIDGQQRTTTFLLLLKALLVRINIAIERTASDEDSASLCRGLQERRRRIMGILYKAETEDISDKPDAAKDAEICRRGIILENFSINEQYKTELSTILQATDYASAEARVIKIKYKQKDNRYTNFFRNFKFFYGNISELSDSQLNSIAKSITDNCEVIEIKSWQVEQAITMFNSLNSDGLPLYDSDIISAKLYAEAEKRGKEKEFADLWKQLNNCINELESTRIADINSILMARFLNAGEYKFFPEVILAANLTDGTKDFDELTLFHESLQSGQTWNKSIGNFQFNISRHASKNVLNQYDRLPRIERIYLAHIKFDESVCELMRIDGNHRLSAADDVPIDFTLPFCLLLFRNPSENDQFTRAIFHNINAKQIPLKLEENLKVILESPQVFSDDTLIRDPSFGWKYYLARKTLQSVDFSYFPAISSYISQAKCSFFVDLFGFLLKNQSVEENDSAISKVRTQLVEVERALIESEITATTTNIAVIGALAYYRLTNESKYRGFLSWIKKNNIGNVEKLHIDDVINLYDEIYKYVPKKVFLARWYPAETDAEYKQSVYRIDAIKEVIDELGLQLTDLGTRDTGTFDIREVMYHDIRECDIFIADLTGARHNVMIEVGYALKHIDTGRMVFYFQETDSCKNVPFDVNHFSYDKIEDSVEIKAKTKARIMKILEQAKNGEI